MICPVKFAAANKGDYAGGCIQEQCAWYDRESDECAVLVIARVMDHTEDRALNRERRKPCPE